jgi:hypothetical protein
MGPKHGIARGVAVFGSPGFADPDRLEGLMQPCERLRKWSLAHGLILNDDPEKLDALDQELDEWNSDSSRHAKVDLPNEVGAYLGNVIVKNIVGSHWKLWPNGHPVIRLLSGKELDVIAMANDRLNHSGASLGTIYSALRL